MSKTIDEIFDKYFPKSKVQPRGFTNELTVEFANWMLDKHRSEFMQAITRLIQQAELRGRIETYKRLEEQFTNEQEDVAYEPIDLAENCRQAITELQAQLTASKEAQE